MPAWLHFDFWFRIAPAILGMWAIIVIAVVFSVLFIAGIFLFMKTGKRYVRHVVILRQRFGGWMMTWGFLGFLWVVFAYERINIFGAPFWVLLGIVGAVVWFLFILRYMMRVVPRLRTENEERVAREKYLPKKKR